MKMSPHIALINTFHDTSRLPAFLILKMTKSGNEEPEMGSVGCPIDVS